MEIVKAGERIKLGIKFIVQNWSVITPQSQCVRLIWSLLGEREFCGIHWCKDN